MILKDTQVYWVNFTNKDTVFPLTQLATQGIHANVKTVDNQRKRAQTINKPVLWLLVFDDISQMKSTDFRQYHANHEAFVIVFTKNLAGNKQAISDLPYPAFSLEQDEAIANALFSQEQLILQRNLFQSEDVDDSLFSQLHFYGRSHAYVQLMQMIKHIAATDVGVFIKGETGTGKELTARSIHYLSQRKAAPFIPINCGAFTDELILSELFGYEKGAFTGATKSKQGLLEAADTGTVFLDEVDSLSLKAQVALLRFLQDSELRAIGSNKLTRVNVRIIAASNKDIKQLVKQEKFREDLLYRLDVLAVKLPPLYQRDEDIQLLAQYFLAQMALENRQKAKVFSASMLTLMANYRWPGNIRELENFIKRAYLLTLGEYIDDEQLLTDSPLSTRAPASEHMTRFKYSFNEEKKVLVNRFEREYLDQILCRARGNISKAAGMAKKERRSFCRLMQKHGLERKSYTSLGNS